MAFGQSSAVVLARVVKVDEQRIVQTPTSITPIGPRLAHLEVVRAWRGLAPGDRITIPEGASDCDYAFTVGTEHVLYLKKLADHYEVPACSRSLPRMTPSGPYAKAAVEMAALDEISSSGSSASNPSSPPPSARSPSPAKGGGCAGCAVLPASDGPSAMGACAVIASLALAGARRRRRRNCQ